MQVVVKQTETLRDPSSEPVNGWRDYDEWWSAITLREALDTINADADEWIAAGEGRIATHLTTDMVHWKGSGIKTAKQLGKYLNDCAERETRRP